MAVAAPLAVSMPDSSVTGFRIAGGRGSHAHILRGCGGEILSAQKVQLENAGAELSHKFEAPVRVGVRAGIVRRPEVKEEARYVNPYLSLDWPGISCGFGLLRSDRRLPDGGSNDIGDVPDTKGTGHIRIGRKVYWSASYMEDVPLATGGYAQTGIGVTGGRAHVWVGAGTVPQDGVGLIGRADVRVVQGFSIGAVGRVGKSGGVTENGFALTVSYQRVHRRSPTPSPVGESAERITFPDSAAGPRDSLPSE